VTGHGHPLVRASAARPAAEAADPHDCARRAFVRRRLAPAGPARQQARRRRRFSLRGERPAFTPDPAAGERDHPGRCAAPHPAVVTAPGTARDRADLWQMLPTSPAEQSCRERGRP